MRSVAHVAFGALWLLLLLWGLGGFVLTIYVNAQCPGGGYAAPNYELRCFTEPEPRPRASKPLREVR